MSKSIRRIVASCLGLTMLISATMPTAYGSSVSGLNNSALSTAVSSYSTTSGSAVEIDPVQGEKALLSTSGKITQRDLKGNVTNFSKGYFFLTNVETNESIPVSTDAEGHYEIEDLKDGEYRIFIGADYKAGLHRDGEFEFEVENGTTDFDFNMELQPLLFYARVLYESDEFEALYAEFMDEDLEKPIDIDIERGSWTNCKDMGGISISQINMGENIKGHIRIYNKSVHTPLQKSRWIPFELFEGVMFLDGKMYDPYNQPTIELYENYDNIEERQAELTGTIYYKNHDGSTGPLAGVRVAVEGMNGTLDEAITDENGQYKLYESLPDDLYHLYVYPTEKTGYKYMTEHEWLEVKSGNYKNKEVDVYCDQAKLILKVKNPGEYYYNYRVQIESIGNEYNYIEGFKDEISDYGIYQLSSYFESDAELDRIRVYSEYKGVNKAPSEWITYEEKNGEIVVNGKEGWSQVIELEPQDPQISIPVQMPRESDAYRIKGQVVIEKDGIAVDKLNFSNSGINSSAEFYSITVNASGLESGAYTAYATNQEPMETGLLTKSSTSAFIIGPDGKLGLDGMQPLSFSTIESELPEEGRIRLVDEYGNNVFAVYTWMDIYSVEKDDSQSVHVDDDGRFEIPPLEDGTYKFDYRLIPLELAKEYSQEELIFEVIDGKSDFDFDIKIPKTLYQLRQEQYAYGYNFIRHPNATFALEIKGQPEVESQITLGSIGTDNIDIQILSLNEGEDLEGELRIVNRFSDDLVYNSDWLNFEYKNKKLIISGKPYDKDNIPGIHMNGPTIGMITFTPDQGEALSGYVNVYQGNDLIKTMPLIEGLDVGEGYLPLDYYRIGYLEDGYYRVQGYIDQEGKLWKRTVTYGFVVDNAANEPDLLPRLDFTEVNDTVKPKVSVTGYQSVNTSPVHLKYSYEDENIMIFSVNLMKNGRKVDIPRDNIISAIGKYAFHYRAEDYYHNITEGVVEFTIEAPKEDTNSSSSNSSGKKSGGGGGGGGSKPPATNAPPKTETVEEEPVAQAAADVEAIVKGDLLVKNYKKDTPIKDDLVVLNLGKNTDKVKLKEKPRSGVVYVSSTEANADRFLMELKVDLDDMKSPEQAIVYRFDEAAGDWVPVGGFIDEAAGTIKFSTDEMGYFAVLEREKNFDDVKDEDYASEEIKTLASRGVISGYSDDTFKPDASITRAEFASILCNALEVHDKNEDISFTDVDGQWYEDPLKRAVTYGFMSGYNGQMNPTDEINHEQMTVMIMNAYKHYKDENISNIAMAYKDADDISSWAIMAVAQADALGITDDQSLEFAPKEDSTRAEAAMLVYKLLKALDLI